MQAEVTALASSPVVFCNTSIKILVAVMTEKGSKDRVCAHVLGLDKNVKENINNINKKLRPGKTIEQILRTNHVV